MEKAQKKKVGLLELILKYGIPLIISIGLCWLLFRDFNLDEMWHLITSQCNYWWIILMMVVSTLSHVVRAMRWQIQLHALNVRAPLFYVVLSIFGTYAVNLVFPRLGEIWRTGYIAKRQDAPFATVFGSMVADRLADTLTVLILVIITFFVASHSLVSYAAQNTTFYETVRGILLSPVVWGLIVVVIVFVWWLLTTNSSNKTIVKIQNAVNGLWEGFAIVAKMPGRLHWLALTILIWGCYFLQFYVAFFSFPFTAQLLHDYGILPALVGFVLSSIAMGVPSNGGIGPWQWAVIFALGIYGLDGELAGAFANLVLGSNTILVISLGLFTFITIVVSKRSHTSSQINHKHKINNIQK